ncbi:hypothetical protein BSL82_03680 [Tardibacter chloracetimidivorans]|uniref:Uncharacterized protein n=1 Tax=Tardibacter chloracetimidivorans TaxID=1921510 RepID=A0A1L3ZSB5_9SPHN|nr:hypothetical protein BSL82_03680 [Tardibacter chloracetimidivorans]
MPSTHGALSQEAINAALAATYGGSALPMPSITRTTADRFRNQPKTRGVLSAPRPRGALTKSASSLVEQGLRALGASEQGAARAGRSFEEFNYDWNPLSGADIVGTQARRLTDGTGADVTDLALNAGMLAAPLAAPISRMPRRLRHGPRHCQPHS